MPYCSSCGKEIPVDATFCPSCGATTKTTATAAPGPRPAGETEADRLLRDSQTQNFWFKRAVAYVIDWIIVGVATWIIFGIIWLGLTRSFLLANPANLFFPLQPLGFGLTGLGSVLFLLYFTLGEFMYQKTIGKSFMGLKVTTTDGSKFDIGKSFVRNFSKIYPLLLLLDLIGGMFMHVQPGQKFSDHVANTIVVSSR